MRPADTGAATVSVPAGQMMIAVPPQRLRCTVGCGIALILVDRERQLAGLAHILLPSAEGSVSPPDMPAKHADRAVPALLKAMATHQVERARLYAVIVGAARDPRQAARGQRNLDALRSGLAEGRIRISQAVVGGSRIRSVTFDPRYAELVVEEQGKL